MELVPAFRRLGVESPLYLPLNPTTDTLRLVTLQPGRLQDDVICSLAHDAWDNKPSYEALSYVWGDMTDRKQIQLNGRPFRVTENLYSALYHLRRHDEARTLWIDAICINQSDIPERNAQVQQMHKIYSSAREVIIWLGDSDDDSDDAVFFLNCIGDLLHGDLWYRGKKADLVRKNTKYWSRNPHIMEYLDPSQTKFLEKVCRLLQRGWWERAWVVQEFIKGSNVTFRLGRKILDYGVLLGITMFIHWGVGLRPALALRLSFAAGALNDAMDLMDYRDFRGSGEHNIRDLLAGQRHRKCAHAVDKVFSVLSLTKWSIRDRITPDYSKSATDVFCSVVKAYIETYRDLKILCECMRYNPSRPYPSWCPDWMEPRSRSKLSGESQHSMFSASSGPAEAVTFSPNNATMIVPGAVFVDTVIDAQVQKVDEEFRWEYQGGDANCNWNPWGMAQGFVNTGLRIMLNDGARASSVELVHQILLRTLVAGLLPVNGEMKRNVTLDMDPDTLFHWPREREKYFHQVRDRTWGRTVFVSEHGYLGLGPREMENGDCIFILPGCRVPLILREIAHDVYSLVGDAYVHGVMDGLKGWRAQRVKKSKRGPRTISIR